MRGRAGPGHPQPFCLCLLLCLTLPFPLFSHAEAGQDRVHTPLDPSSPGMTSGNGNSASTVAGTAPQNGENKLPQAIVKPQILTHVIEGFVIQEGAEPFPVCTCLARMPGCRGGARGRWAGRDGYVAGTVNSLPVDKYKGGTKGSG